MQKESKFTNHNDWNFIYNKVEQINDPKMITNMKYKVITDLDTRQISCLEEEESKINFLDSIEEEDYVEDRVCMNVNPNKVDQNTINELLKCNSDIIRSSRSLTEIKNIKFSVDYDKDYDKLFNTKTTNKNFINYIFTVIYSLFSRFTGFLNRLKFFKEDYGGRYYTNRISIN